MNSILLTGGSGFIGSHTCLFLLELGYRVYVIDSYENSSPESLRRVLKILKTNKKSFDDNLHIFKGDLRNKSLLENIFNISIESGNSIKSVIHCAGLKSVKESIKSPTKYWDCNVISTLNLIQTMTKFNCKNIVFSSSANIYDDQLSYKPLDEETNINPTNPYGKSKYVIEQLLKDVFISSPKEWRIINLRYFNPIGAHPSGMIGENPVGLPNNIFPLLTRVAIGQIKNLEIYGNDWPTSDGTPIRDYIHIMDLAESHILALNFIEKSEPDFKSVNIGTGKGTSVLELIKIFQKVNKIKIPYIFRNRREGDAAILYANNNLAAKLFKWEPRRSLEDMCRDGWKWQLCNPNGFQKQVDYIN